MDDKDELERQVEDGALFTHSALSVHAERINRVEAFVYGLADALLEGHEVTEDELRKQSSDAAQELRARGEALSGGVALRVDADVAPPDAEVDCASRLHICKAVCCRLSFALSAEEVEAGHAKWELGRPYVARKDGKGCCVHLGPKRTCGIYANRPRVCRSYSCANDERIWTDFDNMILNQKWIEENLAADRPRLIGVLMERVD